MTPEEIAKEIMRQSEEEGHIWQHDLENATELIQTAIEEATAPL